MILFLRKNIPIKGGFIANALTMLTGTTLAQILSVVSAPILSRLFSPEDFGITAVFISISGMFAIIACGRYENAIMLPGEDEDACNILALSSSISFVISLLVLIGVACFSRHLATLLKNSDLSPWIWWIPVNIFITGFVQACIFWNSRKKQFYNLTISKVTSSVASLVVSVGIGFLTQGGPLGLIAGQIAAWTVGAAVLSTGIILRDLSFLTKNIKKNNMLRQASIYRHFPLLNSWAILANYGAHKFPILLLNTFFDSTIVGYYFLGYRILNLPLQFILASISQVFFQHYEEKKKTKGKRKFIEKIVIYLASIAIIPSFLLILFAPYMFKIIFGENWIIAGEYIQILVPLLYFRIIASPISTVAFSEGKNLWYLLWQCSLLTCSVLSFFIGGYLKEIYIALILFSISGSINYIVFIINAIKMASDESD